jgi:PBP1b-binding outer membrane lipoprotein LpoB
MIKLKHLALVALAALLLGACSSAAAPTATYAPAQDQPTATDRPTVSAPTETPTMPPPTATEPLQVAAATQSPQPAADTPTPVAVSSFLDVGLDEWFRGPADAQVTIIEYSDFQ